MSEPTPIGVAHARRVAAEIATEWGEKTPHFQDSFSAVLDMLAHAYSRGAADGYREAADLATESYRNLVVLMSKEAGR